MKTDEQTAESGTTSSQPAGPFVGVAVIVPCDNEELTVAKVVADFTQALPGAQVLVYDNNSTDKTAIVARGANALVRRAPRQG